MKPLACITGASRGIGRQIALQLAEEGYDLFISCAHSASLLERTKAEAEAAGARCVTFVGDIGSPDDCGALFRLLQANFPTLDVLVLNAGISQLGLLQDMGIADWDRMIRTDLSSAFYLSRLAIPMMISAGHGKIIALSSVWGHSGASCEVAYSAAKGGLNAFTKALAKELAPANIQVNAVAPGVIETEMNGFLSSEERRDLEEEIPAGRFGTAKEVAELVGMLAASGSYLTGQILTLSGGWEI